MSNQINDAFINALLADATYALDESTPNNFKDLNLKLKLQERLTPELAQYVADNFIVITHIETDDVSQFETGFDATIWKNKHTDQLYLSTTGTQGGDGPNDIITDIDLTLGNGIPSSQVIDMINWWFRITTPVNDMAKQIKFEEPLVRWTDVLGPLGEVVQVFMPDTYEWADSVEGEGIDVLMNGPIHLSTNGHSLGGNLAATFALLFNDPTKGVYIDEVNTYNSAGYNWNADSSFANLRQLIPIGAGSSRYIHNNYFAANGPEVTTREWVNTQLGARIGLNQEFTTNSFQIPIADYEIINGIIYLLPQIENHSMYKLTDMLALADLFATIDPMFSAVDPYSGLVDSNFGTLPPFLNANVLNKIFDFSSNAVSDSNINTIDSRYEYLLDSLRTFLGMMDSPTSVGDAGDSVSSRTLFHENISNIRNALNNNPEIKNLIGKIAFNVDPVSIDKARKDFDQFLSLYFSFPFTIDATDDVLKVLHPEIYNLWEQDKNLSTEDLTAGNANFSTAWYQDRYAYYSLLMERNKNDIATGSSIDENKESANYVSFYNDFNDAFTLYAGNVNKDSDGNALKNVDRIVFDEIAPQEFSKTLFGNEGNDRIYGFSGEDKIYGNEGNDLLDGGADDDTLVGGEGYDVLKGGKGTDTYIFDTKFGKDQIIDADGKGTIVINGVTLGILNLVEGTDIVYRDSVDNAKFEIIKINNGTTTDLLISALGSDGGQILVKNWSDAAGKNLGLTLDDTAAEDTATRTEINGNSNDNAISLDNLRDNNSSFNIEAITHTEMNGGEGAGKDIIMGMADTGDHIIGGDGNDILSGGFTNSLTNSASQQLTPAIDQPAKDTIEGGAGNDTIFSQVGGSVAHGGDNNDTLYAGFGGYFFIDDIRLLAANEEQGIPGHEARSRDEIYADIIDTIYFSHIRTYTPVVVNGQTLISAGYELHLDYLNNLTGELQKFETTTEGLSYIGKRTGVPSNVDKTDVSYAFSGQYYMSYNYQEKDGALSIISRDDSYPVYFTGGDFKPGIGKTIDDYASLKGANLYGDDGDDLLLGGMFADYLSGGTGSDFIRADAGHDIVDGGDGVDYLYGQEGDDIVLGGKDNDHIWGEKGKDNLFGGDGDDYISGGDNDDYLVGGAGKDSLYGDGGNDILVMSKEDSYFDGGAGNDLYIIDDFIFTEAQVNAAQSGNTSPYLVSTQNGKSKYQINIGDHEGNDTLALTGVNNFSSLGVRAQDNDVVLTIGDTSIYVVNGMQGSIDKIVSGESADAIQQGQVTQQINIRDFLVENVSNSINITAQTANTEIIGGRINDTLAAHSGGSQLRGGKGDDQLNGEIGNDTYFYSLNDGNDTITEKGGNNTIKFAVDITADMVDVKRINNQLQLHISNGQIIRVNNMFDVNGVIIQINAIQQIQFANGDVWDQARLLQEIVKPRSIIGTDFSETLIGAEGNDTLTGKKGNDLLQGSLGDDTYQFSATDGEDTIIDTQGNDRILFDNTVDENSITVRRDAQNNLLINIDPLLASPLPGGGTVPSPGKGRVRVGSDSTIESIQFANGNIWDSAKIESEIAKQLSLTQAGTSGSDALKGDDASNIFIGNQGNDTLIGGAANDTYQYALGDGNDVIQDTDGIDKIKFTNIADPSSVLVERVGDDLKLKQTDGSDITVKNYFVPKAANIVDPKIIAIIDQLQNRWVAQTEKLIQQHYGLTATGSINIRFATGIDSLEAAHVEYTYTNGSSVPTSLTLEIDLTDFADVLNNPNGNAPVYFDRVIAHEMVHAIMSMNMNMTQLPGWFAEGTAELIHGADERVKADEGFLNVESNFIGLFKTTVGSPSHTAGYSISYLAVKLLDKEIRDNGGLGIKEIFDQLKTGKTLDQAFIAVSAAHPGLQTIWTSLVSFENHFKEIGFAQYQNWVNLNNVDTGSIAGSDYGFAALTAEAIVPDSNIGSPTGLQLTVPENYIPSPQINGTIETIEFADGTIWNQSQILVEIDKTFNRSFTGTTSIDVITATNGNNTITGLAGDDQLNGLAGNDTYRYNLGDGNDVIVDSSGTDAIEFGAGINPNQVLVQQSQADMQIILQNGSVITVQNTFDASGNFTSNAIETIRFLDNSVWDQSQILIELDKTFNRSFIGTTSIDVITATNGNNTITGLAGDDQLNGLAGNDTYVYNLGDGNDVIVDSSGTDAIEFGAGINPNQVLVQKSQSDLQIIVQDDSIITVKNAFDAFGNFTSSAIENIRFSDNSTWDQSQILVEIDKTFNRSFTGTTSIDVITATNGNNTITGLAGDDQLNGLAGNDTYRYSLIDGNDVILDSSGTDAIEFGVGINPAEIRIQKYQTNHMQILLKDGSVITVQNAFDASGNFTANAIESIRFADNTVWDENTIKIESQKIPSVILTGTVARDFLTGGAGDDILTGAGGIDLIKGGLGNDRYIYNLGDGEDTILDVSGTDSLEFGSGIEERDIRIKKFGANHLVVAIKDNESLVLLNVLDDSGNYTTNSIERFTFANGVTWDFDKIKSEVLKPASLIIDGKPASETLQGFDGDDVITGMKGQDTLQGGNGSDTYVYRLGDGSDTISDASGVDKIVLGAGIKSEDISLQRNQTSLQIKFIDGDVITLSNAFDVNGNPSSGFIENIIFSDNTIWNTEKILIESISLNLFGTDQADSLIAGNGDDDLRGNKGNDALSGGSRNDRYFYNMGDGSDVIDDIGGIDRLIFDAAIKSNEIRIRQESNDLQILFKDGNSITVKNALSNGSLTEAAIEAFVFADGSNWDAVKIQEEINKPYSQTFDGNLLPQYFVDGSQTLIGGVGDDIFIGGKGNDVISGGIGDDTYIWNLGDGFDYIYDISGVDRIVFGEGVDPEKIYFGRVNGYIHLGGYFVIDETKAVADGKHALIESISFANGVTWDFYEKLLSPTLSNDHIRGFASNDILQANGGWDYLEGGKGNDEYRFSKGDSEYVSMLDGEGADKLTFGEGFNLDGSMFQLKEDNLYISFKTGEALAVLSYESNNTIQLFEFNNGLSLSANEINLLISTLDSSFQNDEVIDQFFIGSNINDDISGTILDDQLEGGEGNDQLSGGLGRDVLQGELGDDTLYGGLGDDILFGGAGNDLLYANYGRDTLYGDSGNDYLKGGSYQYGGEGNDTLVVTFDNAGVYQPRQLYDLPETVFMDGGLGDDTYIAGDVIKREGFEFGYLQNFIITDSGGNDLLVLPEGVNANNIAKLLSYDNLIAVEKIKFNDGTIVNSLSLWGSYPVTDGDDIILKPENDNYYLNGRAGDDTYVYRKEYTQEGYDTYIGDSSGQDKIIFNDINSYDVSFGIFDSQNLTFNIQNNRRVILFDRSIETVEFADGYIMDVTRYFNQAAGTYWLDDGFPIGFVPQPNARRSQIYAWDNVEGGTEGMDAIEVTGVPGTTISIKHNDLLIGSAVLDTSWYIKIAIAAEYRTVDLSVTATDAAGYVSAVTKLVIPTEIASAPFVKPTASLLGDGSVVVGTAEAGAIVYVKIWSNVDGWGYHSIANSYAKEDGTFEINLSSPYLSGETLKVVAYRNGDYASSDVSIIAPDKTLPTIPTASFYTASFITGTAEKNSSIVVKNSDGVQIGTAIANATTGEFSVSLTSALTNKEIVSIIATDTAGNSSNELLITAQDKTAPILSSASFNVTADIVYGVTEAGATVLIRNASNSDLASAVADANGQYVVHLPAALAYNTSVTVRATDAAGNFSVQTIYAPDYLPPLLSTATFNAAGKIISGIADKGSTIVVNYASGTQIGTATANSTTGVYSMTLSTALVNKQVVSVTAKDAAGNISDVINIIAPDLTKPVVPTATFDAAGGIITGVAEMGSTVIVKNSSGTQIGSGTADATTGNYTVTLATALINKETVNVTATDDVGNISTPKSITAPDLTPPTKPTAVFNSAGKIISGTAEKSSTVIVTNAEGVQIGSATASSSSGSYSITLTTALVNKEVVNVVARDAAGNISDIVKPMAPDLTKPDLPTALFDVSTGKTITGVAEVGSTVIVKNSSGTQIGTATADATTGNYTVTLATALKNKQTVNVTVKDAAGNISTPISIIAPDLTAPSVPTASINTLGTTVSGSAEKGSTVIVKTVEGVELGSAIATTTSTTSTTGTFTITLTNAQINKESLKVTAVDIAGNISPELSLTAPDKTPPAAPTATVDSTGKIITGIAEIGSTVIVKNTSNSQLGSVTANATTGAYTITLSTALAVNQTVNVTAKDAAGNISNNTELTRPSAVARIPDSDIRVEQLIQAMASFAPASGVDTNFVSRFDDRVNSVIAVGQ